MNGQETNNPVGPAPESGVIDEKTCSLPVGQQNDLEMGAKTKEMMSVLMGELKDKLEGQKDIARATGDRRLLAITVAELKLFELVRDKTTMGEVVARWLPTLAVEDRDIRGFASTMTDGVAKFIHGLVPWRQLKAGPEVVKKYAQSRIDLSERIKHAVPKEANAWASGVIKGQPDLSGWLPELYRTNAVWSITRFLIDGKIRLLTSLATRLMKLEDMESCTLEQLSDMLLQERQIKHLLIGELYAVLVQIYVTTFSLYWDYINLPVQLDYGGMVSAKGLCQQEGAADCSCEVCKTGKSYKQTSIERIDWMDKLVGPSIVQSKAWGAYAPFIGAIGELGLVKSGALLSELATSAKNVLDAGLELAAERRQNAVVQTDAHKERKQGEKTQVALKARISELERQMEQMRLARARRGEQPGAALVPVAQPSDQKTVRKTEEALRAELAKKTHELERTSELLHSILSANDTDGTEQPKPALSLEEVKQKRGVVIGGHDNLTYKLRREMPNCTFYNPDVKMLDEDAVRNSEYILFFTGYVNHCLTGHALRLARLHSIPCGYTDRTNVNLVMKDVEAIFAEVGKF